MAHAGTIGLLDDPADDTLSDWIQHDNHPPALVVDRTQGRLDDGPPVQTGSVAANVETTDRDVFVGTDGDGPYIDVSRTTPVETLVSDWLADVTKSGVVIAESVGADDEQFPFPFDVFSSLTGSRCRRQAVDVESLGRKWHADEVLSDVWMAGDRVGESVNIRYHSTQESDAANVSIGLGFERSYEGSVARGIVYESGYVACWRNWSPSKFVRFVVDEILPFCEEFDYEAEQADFEDFGGG